MLDTVGNVSWQCRHMISSLYECPLCLQLHMYLDTKKNLFTLDQTLKSDERLPSRILAKIRTMTECHACRHDRVRLIFRAYRPRLNAWQPTPAYKRHTDMNSTRDWSIKSSAHWLTRGRAPGVKSSRQQSSVQTVSSLTIPVITLRDTPHWCIISLIVGPSNFVPVRTQQRKMCPPTSMISYMPWSLRFSNGGTDALKPNRYYEPRTQCLFKSSQSHPSFLCRSGATNKRAGTLFDLSLCFPPFRDEVEGPSTQQKAQKNARTFSATGLFSKPYKHHCWIIQFATSRRNRLQRWADS
jgi:hypothetical protein